MGTKRTSWKESYSTGSVSVNVGQHQSVEVWIVSTPQTVEIINNPDVVGVPFQDKLADGLRLVVEALTTSAVGVNVSRMPCDVLYILRGGLNFPLHTILWKTQKLKAEVSFVSSQRTTDDNGVLQITEDSYTKWSIQSRAVLLVGDICATGTTMDRAIDAAIAEYSRRGISPSALVVFSIGTGNLLDVLERKFESLKRTHTNLINRIIAVYLEGIFSLYAKHEALATTHLPATDFFRKDGILSFELERASLENPVSLIERCAIYDGGSRAFEPHTYLRNLMLYWERMGLLAKTVTAKSLLQVKTDLLAYNAPFATWVSGVGWWKNRTEKELRDLHSKGQSVCEMFAAASLPDIAEGRLSELRKRHVS